MNVVVMPQMGNLVARCASVGRTAADCSAPLFLLPVPASAYAIYKDQIQHHIADELATVDGLMDTERAQKAVSRLTPQQ